MFRKRKKVTFPDGTFIPTKPRVLSIIQLCLGLVTLLFICGKPFMGQHFAVKSKILIYDYVMKNDKKELFETQTEEKKQEIILNYNKLINFLSSSFLDKLHDSFSILFYKTSSFERAWILFAIIVPILLLKKREGATEAAWILPLIALGFLISNQKNQESISEESKLFPKEAFLIDRYLKKDIRVLSIGDQQEELLKGWHLFLVEYYALETPSENLEIFELQIAKGEFRFNLARLEKSPLLPGEDPDKKQPLSLMFAYLGWNLIFAWGVSRGLQQVPARTH